MLRFLLAGLVALVLSYPSRALAQPPDAALMTQLGAFASTFESLKNRASFQIDGRLETVDSSGKADGVKEGRARVVADGKTSQFEVIRYLEDGQDKTAEARQKIADKAKEPKKDEPKREFRMPFHPGEQPRYTFDEVETNPNDPNLVRISFVPKIREQDTVEGDAWVNKATGVVMSAGLRLANPPSGLDYLNLTVTFGNSTSVGPTISSISIEGKIGLLFVHKRFRGQATFSQVTITP